MCSLFLEDACVFLGSPPEVHFMLSETFSCQLLGCLEGSLSATHRSESLPLTFERG